MYFLFAVQLYRKVIFRRLVLERFKYFHLLFLFICIYVLDLLKLAESVSHTHDDDDIGLLYVGVCHH